MYIYRISAQVSEQLQNCDWRQTGFKQGHGPVMSCFSDQLKTICVQPLCQHSTHRAKCYNKPTLCAIVLRFDTL